MRIDLLDWLVLPVAVFLLDVLELAGMSHFKFSGPSHAVRKKDKSAYQS